MNRQVVFWIGLLWPVASFLFAEEKEEPACTCFVMKGEIYGSQEASERWQAIQEDLQRIPYQDIPAMILRIEELIAMHPEAPINALFAQHLARFSYRKVPEGEAPLCEDYGAVWWQMLIEASDKHQYLWAVGNRGLSNSYSRVKDYDRAAEPLFQILTLDPAQIREDDWVATEQNQGCGSRPLQNAYSPERAEDVKRIQSKALERLSWMTHHSQVAFDYLERQHQRQPESRDIASAYERALQRRWFSQKNLTEKRSPAIPIARRDLTIPRGATRFAPDWLLPVGSLSIVWGTVFVIVTKRKRGER